MGCMLGGISFRGGVQALALLAALLLLVACGPEGRNTTPETSPSATRSTSQDVLQNTGARLRPPVEPLHSDTPLLRAIPQEEARAAALDLRKDQQNLASWKELTPPLDRALRYAEAWPPEERAFEHSGLRVTWGEIVASLRLLRQLLPLLDARPELLAERFTWLRMTPQTHFTAYYSPTVAASRTRKPGYEHPLYRLPEELAPELAHCLPSHTCPEDAFTRVIRPETPYHGRAAIDLDGALRGRGLEMAWVSHPFDAYLLMLEGSGMLAFDDGTKQAALFAGLNGSRGKSMAGYLISTGQLARKDATLDGMRRWWDAATPQKRRAFLEAASGYAFFRYGAPAPQGTAGCELTPWVSMATDDRVLPLGGILAYDLPVPGQSKRGLGFAHDTGSAIKLRRIDMYAGEGEDAHQQALRVYTKGDIWLLLPRKTR